MIKRNSIRHFVVSKQRTQNLGRRACKPKEDTTAQTSVAAERIEVATVEEVMLHVESTILLTLLFPYQTVARFTCRRKDKICCFWMARDHISTLGAHSFGRSFIRFCFYTYSISSRPPTVVMSRELQAVCDKEVKTKKIYSLCLEFSTEGFNLFHENLNQIWLQSMLFQFHRKANLLTLPLLSL